MTLIQGGFLALAGHGRAEFLLTHEAEDVLRGGGSLASKVVVPSQRTSVVMERLTGALAPGAELRFIGRRDVNQAWTHAMRLEPQMHHNELDAAQVRHLLPRGQGEWIQWIGPINLMGKDGHWVPVDVDLERARVVGIPDRWDRRLALLILEQAGVAAPPTVDRAGHLPPSWRPPRRGVVDPEGPRLSAERWNLSLDRSDLLVTQQDHDEQFRHMLARAETSVLIGSAFATVSGLERIRSDLADTARRGVRVDLLWGYAADQERMSRSSWNFATAVPV